MAVMGRPMTSDSSIYEADAYGGTPQDDLPLPRLQVASAQPDGLDPLVEEELEPGSFDLVMPNDEDLTDVDNGNGVNGEGDFAKGLYQLEKRSELLFSRRHLQAIFDDPAHLHRFSTFLRRHRPNSVPLLTYYLEALKALRAIDYCNAVVARRLQPLADFDFTHEFYQAPETTNPRLQAKADAAFELLAREDLPMYITHVWIRIVTVMIRHRIMGTLPQSHFAEGLAEVFCLTDPSRPDNPILFMSEEFNRTTQYGISYVVGRNCRFLQGPHTNPFSVKRIRQKLDAGVEHYETFLNYRRDGTPFMNLVMLAPLYDSRGKIRYFIGAQVDVSGLAKDCYGLEALERLVETEGDEHWMSTPSRRSSSKSGGEFRQLAEILEPDEIEAVRFYGGHLRQPKMSQQPGGHSRTHSLHDNDTTAKDEGNWSKQRVVLRDESPDRDDCESVLSRTNGLSSSAIGHSAGSTSNALHSGRLTGVFGHYLLVRPHPSLRILFTSPSMRVPGILQSPFLNRIGGTASMKEAVEQAFARGQSVTARVRWLTHGSSHPRPSRTQAGRRRPRPSATNGHHLESSMGLDEEDEGDFMTEVTSNETKGRPRWLHCTPLLGANGKVGVWMVIIVDDDREVDGNKEVLATRPRKREEHLNIAGTAGETRPISPSIRGHARTSTTNAHGAHPEAMLTPQSPTLSAVGTPGKLTSMNVKSQLIPSSPHPQHQRQSLRVAAEDQNASRNVRQSQNPRYSAQPEPTSHASHPKTPAALFVPPVVRHRRSSDTLGSEGNANGATPSSNAESATRTIHKQTSQTASLRGMSKLPKLGFGSHNNSNNNRSSSELFNPAALARALRRETPTLVNGAKDLNQKPLPPYPDPHKGKPQQQSPVPSSPSLRNFPLPNDLCESRSEPKDHDKNNSDSLSRNFGTRPKLSWRPWQYVRDEINNKDHDATSTSEPSSWSYDNANGANNKADNYTAGPLHSGAVGVPQAVEENSERSIGSPSSGLGFFDDFGSDGESFVGSAFTVRIE